MNAIEVIKQDHRRLERLFSKFLETESDMTQKQLFQEIQTELNAHSEIEEEVLYPELKLLAQDKVEEAIKEHGIWPIRRPCRLPFRMRTFALAGFHRCSSSVDMTYLTFSNRRVRTRMHGGVAGVGG